jgi:uridylate kinase
MHDLLLLANSLTLVIDVMYASGDIIASSIAVCSRKDYVACDERAATEVTDVILEGDGIRVVVGRSFRSANDASLHQVGSVAYLSYLGLLVLVLRVNIGREYLERLDVVVLVMQSEAVPDSIYRGFQLAFASA